MNLQNKSAFYNILYPVVRNGLTFLSIPVFTHLLGPEQYGLVSAYKAWVGIFAIVFGLQIHGCIGVAFSHLKDDEIPIFLSSALTFGLCSSICIVGIGGAFVDYVSEWLMMTRESIGLMIIQAIGLFVISFSSTMFIYYKKSQYSFLVNTIAEALGIGLGLYLTHYCFSREISYLACMYGTAIPIGSLGIILSCRIIYLGDWSFSWKYVRFCLPICLPLILHSLSGMVMGQSDRLMLQHMTGNAEAGIYSFMILFSNVLLTIWTALNQTWLPFYFDDIKNEHIDIIYKKTRNYVYVYSSILAVFILWAPELVSYLAPAEFWTGIHLLPFFVISHYFTFLYSFPANFQFFHMKTYFIAAGTIMTACVNVGLNYYTIPIGGMYGAAFSTLVSHIILYLFHEYIASNVISASYHYSIRFFLPGLLYVCAVVAFFLFFQESVFVRWSGGVVIAILLMRDLYSRRQIF